MVGVVDVYIIETINAPMIVEILSEIRFSRKAKNCRYHQFMEQVATGDINTTFWLWSLL